MMQCRANAIYLGLGQLTDYDPLLGMDPVSKCISEVLMVEDFGDNCT